MHYRSRTRGLWRKGATSGNTQRVVSLTADCDGDAVLARVIPSGPACHVGMTSCFGDVAVSADAFGALDSVIAQRASDLDDVKTGAEESSGSYTQHLLADRNLRLKKIGEESSELVLACADGDKARAVEEAADRKPLIDAVHEVHDLCRAPHEPSLKWRKSNATILDDSFDRGERHYHSPGG